MWSMRLRSKGWLLLSTGVWPLYPPPPPPPLLPPSRAPASSHIAWIHVADVMCCEYDHLHGELPRHTVLQQRLHTGLAPKRCSVLSLASHLARADRVQRGRCELPQRMLCHSAKGFDQLPDCPG